MPHIHTLNQKLLLCNNYPVPAGYFVCYPVLSGSGQILKIAIRYISTKFTSVFVNKKWTI